jgi:hypothetical protein
MVKLLGINVQLREFDDSNLPIRWLWWSVLKFLWNEEAHFIRTKLSVPMINFCRHWNCHFNLFLCKSNAKNIP